MFYVKAENDIFTSRDHPGSIFLVCDLFLNSRRLSGIFGAIRDNYILSVSKGGYPGARRSSSAVMRQQSSSSLKPLDRFTSNWVCSILVTVTPKFAHMISIGPLYGSRELKIEKPLDIFFYRTISG
jgi:hypothetical protein